MPPPPPALGARAPPPSSSRPPSTGRSPELAHDICKSWLSNFFFFPCLPAKSVLAAACLSTFSGSGDRIASHPVLSCPVQERHRLLVAASPRFAAPQKSIAFIGGHGSLTSEPSLPVCQKTYRVSACRSCGALVPLPFPLHVKPRSLPTSPALLLSFALPPLNILAAVPYRRALASGWALTPA